MVGAPGSSGRMAATVLAATLVLAMPVVAIVNTATARAAGSSSRSTHYLLDHLTVSSGYHVGYERAQFTLWTSHPDGCNTRYKVLIRDATVKPTVSSGCVLHGGTWVSPYDGLITHDPADLQIDHVVPLGAAWGAGAWRWDADTRRRFANDLGTRYDLLAVSAHENESKGDDGPETWLPERASFQCRYMADYTAVLWRWRLQTDPTQKAFLASRLASCGWPRVNEPPRPAIHRTHPADGSGGSGTAKGVRIAAIQFDSPGDDTGGNASLDAEWVRLANGSTSAASLTGATLHDASGHVYAFPSFTLKAHATVEVHTGSGRDTAANLYWNAGNYIWNNTGDTATLDNASGDPVDSCGYTAASDPVARC